MTWESKKLGDITTKIGSGATPRGGQKSYKTEGISLIRSMNVHDRYFKDKNLAFIDDEQANDLSNVILQANDVLLNITGASIARCCIVPNKYLPARVNQHVSIIRPNPEIMDSSFLNLLLTSKYYKDQLLFTGEQGSTRQAITKVQLQNFVIRYPLLPEQKRIVAILDEAFENIAHAKESAEKNLKNANEIFEGYLQSVFEDKSEVWEEKTLGDSNIIEIIDGDRGKNYPTKKEFLEEGFCLFMNTKNVRPDGFEFNTQMFINEAKDNAMGKGKLRRGDVVMTTRGTIGNLGVYNEEVEYNNIRINSGMLIFRPNLNQITSEYLYNILRSAIIKEQIKKHVSGAAQPQLPIKTLKNFSIPIPKSISEQQSIIAKLDALSAETKKLEAIYTQKLTDLEELKKSILAKAFNGELTEASA